MLTTPKLKELQRPILIHNLPLLQAHKVSCISAERLQRNAIKTLCCVCDDLYHACKFVYLVSFLILTGRCYDAETSVILLL